MKAKEKAKELFDKYNDVTALNLTCDIETTKAEIHNHAKECALITAHQLIVYIPKVVRYEGSVMSSEYWLEVKQEIEKL